MPVGAACYNAAMEIRKQPMLTSETSASPAAERRPAIRTHLTMARGLSLLALALLLAGLALLAVRLLRPAPLPYEPVDSAVLQAALEAGGTLSAERRTVVDAALSLVGQVHYFWGGKSGTIGFDPGWGEMAVVEAAGSETTGTLRPRGLDCSGYTSWCFIQTGMTFAEMEACFGNGTHWQWQKSEPVAWNELQPGDLLFQHEPGAGKGNHVGIVVGFTETGEPLVAHCAAGFDGVVVTGRGDIFRYPRRPRCYGT